MDVASYINNDWHGQDRLFIGDEIYAVMDGVTCNDGGFAAEALHQRLQGTSDLQSVINTIWETNSFLQSKEVERRERYGILTTIVAYGEDSVISAGDSVAYAVKNHKGAIVNPLDNVRIGDVIIPNQLSQAVGGLSYINRVRVSFDYLLLMSDGISDNLEPGLLLECCVGTAQETKNAIVEALDHCKNWQNKYGDYEPYGSFGPYKYDDQALIVLRNN